MTAENRLIYHERKIWEFLPSVAQRIERGKQQRSKVSRESHAEWNPKADRSDPVQILIDSGVGRVEKLVPIRYGRMLQSPFAFLRGSAAVMAKDLSDAQNSGVIVQCCGDCHLMNFGGYATPERNQVFDINDFDETLPAPFEWDIKRLAASIVVAGRYREFSDKDNRKAAFNSVNIYTQKIREFSMMRQLEIWYNRIDESSVIEAFKSDKEFIKRTKKISAKARERTHEFVFPRISELKEGKRKIVDDPPLIYHPDNTKELIESAYDFFDRYYFSLPDDRRSLLDRYKLEDVALKVVGVGSVGTRCLIGLFALGDKDAIILQFKEAGRSVLENYAGESRYKNHGERIVNGQRLMQTVSDIFLGWSKTQKGIDFYIRQLRDMKSSATIETFTPQLLYDYASLCGWALAKTHAKAGRSPEITGYIGKSGVFSKAVADFAIRYADQTEADFALLKVAEKNGRIKVAYDKVDH
jgi:uncharacterized protein (DUF2252 family)